MAAPVNDGHNYPTVPPTPSNEVFLARLNKRLNEGRYHIASIEDLRANRFQKAQGESMFTEKNLATHVLVELDVCNHPNLVGYQVYRQDGMGSYINKATTLEEALWGIGLNRQNWSKHEGHLLVAAQIEIFRGQYNPPS